MGWMDRLTYRYGSTVVCNITEKYLQACATEGYCGKCDMNTAIKECLAAYEDTGLTPDDIAALRDELRDAEYRAEKYGKEIDRHADMSVLDFARWRSIVLAARAALGGGQK